MYVKGSSGLLIWYTIHHPNVDFIESCSLECLTCNFSPVCSNFFGYQFRASSLSIHISEKRMDHGTYISATKLCSKLISVKLEVDDKNNKGKIAEWLL